MQLKDSQIAKQKDIDLLRKRYTTEVRDRLHAIDYRLAEYFDDLTTNVGIELADEHDKHNRWEVLCGAKFLRMFVTYHFNVKWVQFVIHFREGNWVQEGKMWRYVSGGLKLPSTSGAKVYRWQPFQVFVLASVFGFMAWFNTHVEAGTKPELLPSERERDGYVMDFRRLINEFIMYGPRKIDKTGLSAYIQVIFFLFGDFNSEIYSLAMTQDQSKILFERTKFMLAQVTKDQDGNERFRMTQKIVDWKEKYQKEIRNSKIMPLTGGGKAPDGTNTELLDWDELGSSPYVNGKSDMLAHINVCQSSMGQRRQPLTFGTTTAGTIQTGPFIEKLEVLHKILLQEHAYESGNMEPTLASDGTMCLLLEPDEYERENEQYILTSHALRRKINPMLGLVVQYDFYEREMEKARNEGGLKFAECVAKLFNVYKTGQVTEWIKAEQVRPLQRTMRIDECTKDKGWVIFVGLDFSQGDDLHTASYLACRKHPSGRGTEFFADCDVWVKESTAQKSAIRPLYEGWNRDGWLQYSPGQVFEPALFIERLRVLISKGCQFMTWGYDKYRSKDPINTLKAFLQSEMHIPNPEPYCQVVSQLNSVFDGPTDDLYKAMFATVPYISFSNSPLWPFCFGNCVLEIDNRRNKRPVKRAQTDSCKVDPVQALIMAMELYERYEGTLH